MPVVKYDTSPPFNIIWGDYNPHGQQFETSDQGKEIMRLKERKVLKSAQQERWWSDSCGITISLGYPCIKEDISGSKSGIFE